MSHDLLNWFEPKKNVTWIIETEKKIGTEHVRIKPKIECTFFIWRYYFQLIVMCDAHHLFQVWAFKVTQCFVFSDHHGTKNAYINLIMKFIRNDFITDSKEFSADFFRLTVNLMSEWVVGVNHFLITVNVLIFDEWNVCDLKISCSKMKWGMSAGLFFYSRGRHIWHAVIPHSHSYRVFTDFFGVFLGFWFFVSVLCSQLKRFFVLKLQKKKKIK